MSPTPPIYHYHAEPSTRALNAALSSTTDKTTFLYRTVGIPCTTSAQKEKKTSYNIHSISHPITLCSQQYLVPHVLETKDAYMMPWELCYEGEEAKRKERDYLGDWEGRYVVWYVPKEREMLVMRIKDEDELEVEERDGMVKYGSVPRLRELDWWWWNREMRDLEEAFGRALR